MPGGTALEQPEPERLFSEHRGLRSSGGTTTSTTIPASAGTIPPTSDAQGIHHGREVQVRQARAEVLTAAYTRNPQRFVRNATVTADHHDITKTSA